MSETWTRDSFRPGGGDYGLLEEMQAQEAENAGKEREEGGRDDGRGAMEAGGAPRPLPGDELYDTLHQAQAENMERQAMQQRAQQHDTPAEREDSALSFAALIAASSQQQGQPQEPTPYQAAQQQATQPDVERPQPATFQALRAEQAAAMPRPEEAQQPEASPVNEGPTRPGERQAQNGLMSDFVTEDTQQAVEADRAQQRQQQHTRTMGLTM